MLYEVITFEADSEVGGKLRQVIPAERLPAEALTSEIDRIKGLGIVITSYSIHYTKLYEAMRSRTGR